MFKEASVIYAITFFLGIVFYSPILLFSTEKYKSGLKCAAAICFWLIMMVSTVTLLFKINPELMRSLTAGQTCETKKKTNIESQAQNNPYGRKFTHRSTHQDQLWTNKGNAKWRKRRRETSRVKRCLLLFHLLTCNQCRSRV
jgi:hypothetical protein